MGHGMLFQVAKKLFLKIVAHHGLLKQLIGVQK